jgi:hypothetical protein
MACLLSWNNVTNMHFHGFHISPSRRRFVLLSLYPEGTPRHSQSDRAGRHVPVTLDPIPYTQAGEPTGITPQTWFHGTTGDERHGRCGLIAGPFDDWLNGLYASVGGVTEQVLIVSNWLREQFLRLGTATKPQPGLFERDLPLYG